MKIRPCKAGVHLFDRKSGLSILLDEQHVAPEYWARAPRTVSIALTNACDLRCPYCYVPKRSAMLDEGRVKSWLGELDAEGCLGVGFGGGEPLLFPGFSAVCRAAAASTRLAVTFTTHGHALTPAIAGEIAGYVHFVRVSMDGIGATYASLRGRPFDRFRRQLAIVRDIAPFGINTVVNERTVHELDAIAEFAAAEGAAELLLLPEQPTDGRPGVNRETQAAMERWVSRTPRRIRLAVSELGATAAMPIADPFGCEDALDGHAHVDALGYLKPTAFSRQGVPIRQSVLLALDELRRKLHS